MMLNLKIPLLLLPLITGTVAPTTMMMAIVDSTKSAQSAAVVTVTDNDWIEIENQTNPLLFKKTISNKEYFLELYDNGYRVFYYSDNVANHICLAGKSKLAYHDLSGINQVDSQIETAAKKEEDIIRQITNNHFVLRKRHDCSYAVFDKRDKSNTYKIFDARAGNTHLFRNKGTGLNDHLTKAKSYLASLVNQKNV